MFAMIAAKRCVHDGADIDGKNGGVPPLIWAAWWGQVEIINWLLEMEEIDTDVRHKICKGGNACHAACGRNYAKAIEALVKGGCSRYEEDDKGTNCYMVVGKYAKGEMKAKAQEVRDYYTYSRGDGKVRSVRD